MSREAQKEASPSRETLAPQQTGERPQQSKEVKNKADEVMRADNLDAVEGSEGAEMADGKISEGASEDKKYAPAGGVKSLSTDEIEAIRAKLLAAIPPQEVMIKQIRNKLVKQEKILNKKMHKLQGKAHMNAFQLTIVVGQLRKVREYFAMLAHATYELIKHLWLKIVHGV